MFEQGTATIQALARSWINSIAPLAMLEQEGHNRIQNAMPKDGECVLRKVQRLMQSSVNVQRVIPEHQEPELDYTTSQTMSLGLHL